MTTISSLAKSYDPATIAKTSSKKVSEETTSKKSSETDTDSESAVSTSSKSEYEISEKSISAMVNESNRKTEEARALFSKVFGNQANSGVLSGVSDETDLLSSLQKFAKTGQVDFYASAEDIAQAKEDTSEDGYYGVKKTSERILSFAKALSGGDESKIEELKEAVVKAFDEVKEMFGGELPQISKDTYDAVMKGFDEWQNPSTEETTTA